MLKKISIDESYNDVVDVVELIKNEFDDKFEDIFKTFNKSNSFIINRYYENDVAELIKRYYDVEIEKYYKSYELNNKTYYDVEFEIIDKIYKSIFINIDQLTGIFKDKINDVDKLFNCNIKAIQQLINDDIVVAFIRNDENIFNKFSKKNKFNSYDLLKLFDDIVDDVKLFNDEIENDDELIESYELMKLFKYVVEELNKFSYFNSSNKFKINLSNRRYLTLNNKFNIFMNDEIIYDILYDDLIECIDEYLIDYFKIYVDVDINELLFLEELYLNNLSNELFDIDYNIEIDDKFNYVEYSIELSIDEILKINDEIDDINLLLFDPDKIDEIFENFNDNYDDDEFIYLIFENEFELLLNDDKYCDNSYYTINKPAELKIDNIHELNDNLLNQLQHLNLMMNYMKYSKEW